MDDFPQNLTEFRERFSTEQACFNYLVNLRLRWSQGFKCPICGNQSQEIVSGKVTHEVAKAGSIAELHNIPF